MTQPERVSTVRPSGGGHDPSKAERRETERYLPIRIREKRFEVGFFFRKIVSGWLAYCKKLPASSRAEFFQALRAPAPNAPEEGGGGELQTGGIQPLSGTGKGSGDGGPVGETRVEVG
ncbi:MAG TPA: hypothetical protein VLF66_12950, partial [Thermoanaerobaculia bacterium]|nr:hypothetical protein [Thermoanaerobaculia bacterium]